MKKRLSIISNAVLLVWFFLDMIGISFQNKILVSRSYQDDGIFFIIFIIVFIWFIVKEKSGKFIISGWLFMWFAMQFYFHWIFTIFGPWEEKIKYYTGTIKLIPSTKVYFPDLYHIILHLLILITFISVVNSCILSERNVNKRS